MWRASSVELIMWRASCVEGIMWSASCVEGIVTLLHGSPGRYPSLSPTEGRPGRGIRAKADQGGAVRAALSRPCGLPATSMATSGFIEASPLNHFSSLSIEASPPESLLPFE